MIVLLEAVEDIGIATLAFNRPDRHDAFDAMTAGPVAALTRPEQDPAVRVVVLKAAGRSFSAGANLDRMRRTIRRASAEGRESIAAFLERRAPAWRRPDSRQAG